MFWTAFREMDPQLARERVSAMRATLNAIGMAFRGKEQGSSLPKSVRDDMLEARLLEKD